MYICGFCAILSLFIFFSLHFVCLHLFVFLSYLLLVVLRKIVGKHNISMDIYIYGIE